jgi:L-seryl-tRNA(Ser) seleniumtransferase
MLREPITNVRRRAQQLTSLLGDSLGDSPFGGGVKVVATRAAVGGGSLPGHDVPSAAVRIGVGESERVAARLRKGNPPVFCRTEGAAILFDMRTVPAEQLVELAKAIEASLEV